MLLVANTFLAIYFNAVSGIALKERLEVSYHVLLGKPTAFRLDFMDGFLELKDGISIINCNFDLSEYPSGPWIIKDQIENVNRYFLETKLDCKNK